MGAGPRPHGVDGCGRVCVPQVHAGTELTVVSSLPMYANESLKDKLLEMELLGQRVHFTLWQILPVALHGALVRPGARHLPRQDRLLLQSVRMGYSWHSGPLALGSPWDCASCFHSSFGSPGSLSDVPGAGRVPLSCAPPHA